MITNEQISSAYESLRGVHGGLKQDYFALLWLEREYHLSREEALQQITLGGNDYGLDGFHFDDKRRVLFLFQFKWTASHEQLKDSVKRLMDAGVDRLFGNPRQDPKANQLLIQFKAKLARDKALVDSVILEIVFNGELSSAVNSSVLRAALEDIEDKKFLMDRFFGRTVSFSSIIRTNKAKEFGPTQTRNASYQFDIGMEQMIERTGPAGERMLVGFLRLVELGKMYVTMKSKFFEKNIRSSLPPDSPPNRSINDALKGIVLRCSEPPEVFEFDHNGITIFAETLDDLGGGRYRIVEPKLLNGAQTITTFCRFLDLNRDNPQIEVRKDALGRIRVMARIITSAKRDFVVHVTVNNNRQNPVRAWNLRANDEIQLHLHDKFRDQLGPPGIFYERQDHAFEDLTDDDLGDQYQTGKPLKIIELAKTFVACDGDVDRLVNIGEVFENQKYYDHAFRTDRLSADARRILVLYKIIYRIGKTRRDIINKGQNKYHYLKRGGGILHALLCQGLLNDSMDDAFLEQHGRSLVVDADYSAMLSRLATVQVRSIISEVVIARYEGQLEADKVTFLRTNAFFRECMEVARKRYKWKQESL